MTRDPKLRAHHRAPQKLREDIAALRYKQAEDYRATRTSSEARLNPQADLKVMRRLLARAQTLVDPSPRGERSLQDAEQAYARAVEIVRAKRRSHVEPTVWLHPGWAGWWSQPSSWRGRREAVIREGSVAVTRPIRVAGWRTSS